MNTSSFFLFGALIGVVVSAANAQTSSVDEKPVVATAPRTASLGALLQLEDGQIERLKRLHDDHIERAASWNNTRKIADDLKQTRAKSLRVLTPVQRAQLESFATDSRFQWRADWMHPLLLQPVDEADYPEPRARSKRRSRLKGSGNYGVYGGYSYGRPDVGVYGNYGQGAVGVHGGIGRGGPSIGVSIGRVFGVFR